MISTRDIVSLSGLKVLLNVTTYDDDALLTGILEAAGARPGGANDCRHAGQFILHLNTDTAGFGKLRRDKLSHLAGRRYRVAGEKITTGIDRPISARLITQDEISFTFEAAQIPSFVFVDHTPLFVGNYNRELRT